jgi:hypothetical protein
MIGLAGRDVHMQAGRLRSTAPDTLSLPDTSFEPYGRHSTPFF